MLDRDDDDPASVQIPLEEGTKLVRIETAPNAAGNVGFSEIAITIEKREIPGTSTVTLIPGTSAIYANIHIPAGEQAAVDDHVQFYFGDRDPQADDPALPFDSEAPKLVFNRTWGQQGENAGEFQSLSSIDCDGNGDVFISDGAKNCIHKFDSDGNFILLFGASGAGEGEFNSPGGLCVSNDRVYVGDYNNHRVQVFDISGAFLFSFGSYGSYRSAGGYFNKPAGIAADTNGNIYVADQWNYRIQKFDSDGNFILKFGSYGSGDGQFNLPCNLAIDDAENIYVSESRGSRIQKFDAEGHFIKRIADSGSALGSVYYPSGILMRPDNSFLVADMENHRLQQFSLDGEFLGVIGQYGSEAGEFNSPVDLARAPDGTVYVVDSRNYRIQTFIPWYDFKGEIDGVETQVKIKTLNGQPAVSGVITLSPDTADTFTADVIHTYPDGAVSQFADKTFVETAEDSCVFRSEITILKNTGIDDDDLLNSAYFVNIEEIRESNPSVYNPFNLKVYGILNHESYKLKIINEVFSLELDSDGWAYLMGESKDHQRIQYSKGKDQFHVAGQKTSENTLPPNLEVKGKMLDAILGETLAFESVPLLSIRLREVKFVDAGNMYGGDNQHDVFWNAARTEAEESLKGSKRTGWDASSEKFYPGWAHEDVGYSSDERGPLCYTRSTDNVPSHLKMNVILEASEVAGFVKTEIGVV